jgi:uncharacterized protein (DUF983 family)
MRGIDLSPRLPQPAHMTSQDADPRRDTWLAVKRGLRLRCPACGKGRLLGAYLRPADNCSACGEATGEIRADDAPAWATILLVGHLVSPMFFVFATQDAAVGMIAFLVMAALVVGLTLALLPRMKGLFVALIWASRAGEAAPE